jgi:hypothetical protein
MQPNSSFSTALPTLQLAIDSTSLGAFKKCPRFYQLSIIEGYRPRVESVHLTWGILAHSTIEHYHHFRAEDADHETALRGAIRFLLKATWRNGSPWQSDHPTKNRFTLLRSMIFYLDRFGSSDPIQTIHLSNGKPAVELSFRFDSELKTLSTQETILLCGHLDRLGTLNDTPYVVDFKSTQYSLSSEWFAKFTPFNQFTIYILAGRVVWKVPVNDLIVDGCQTTAMTTRFQRGLVTRSDYQLEDWRKGFQFTIREMERCAIKNYWPQRETSCDLYGGCDFRGVCSQKTPEASQQMLDGMFHRRIWDPLQVRGDI